MITDYKTFKEKELTEIISISDDRAIVKVSSFNSVGEKTNLTHEVSMKALAREKENLQNQIISIEKLIASITELEADIFAVQE